MTKQQSHLVLAAFAWKTNADLIADVAKLGYLKPTDTVLDPTYGRGLWWKKFKPAVLIKHDLYKLDGVNYENLPEDDCSVDAVAFDPPYVAQGGRKTSRVDERNDRYGLVEAPRTPEALAASIALGIKECARVLKPKGFLIVKAKDYISSGKFFDGTGEAKTAALGAGLRYVDRFEHLGSPGPQPKHKTQKHSRRNLSTLLVFSKPPAPRRRKVTSKAA